MADQFGSRCDAEFGEYFAQVVVDRPGLRNSCAVLGKLPGWLAALTAGWIPAERAMAEYRYVGGIMENDAARLGLRRRYPPFARLPDGVMRTLGISTPAYAFPWNEVHQMSKVIAGFSMSLDGFVADPDDGVEQVFKWYSAGGTDAEVMVGDHAVEMAREGAEFIEEAGRGAGVLVTARRTFELAHAWGGKHPMDVPMVVVTHRVPEEWASREGSPFTFVTEGVPKAIDVAREIAGGKDVVVGAPSVTQQCLQLGLLDAIHIDLAPVVLGRGIRLFDHLTEPVEFLVSEASGNPHVTHLTYQIIR